MRQPLVFCLIALLAAAPAYAQTADDASIYEVTDVAVDITADSAAHARDQAVAEAQHTALEQLLGHLGADSSLAAKIDDDTLASLVQSFEVQNERSSSVRYIGTFTVQFRPSITREWLNKNGAAYTETRSKPLVVLPVYVSNNRPILWEQRTKWRAAWDTVHNAGLVPIVVPNGSLDDVSIVSGAQAVNGDGDALQSIAEKYQAGGTVVATLEGDVDNPGAAFKIKITRVDEDGAAEEPIFLNLQPAADKAAIDNTLAQAVRQVRDVLEGDWRQTIAKSSQAAPARLAVTVPIDTLDEWELIKRKLDSVHSIDRTDIITLARGTTSIELEYRGDIEHLQDDLSRQELTLTQEGAGGWILQLAAAGSPL